LLRLKASRARVFQSSLKTSGCAAWIVYVASSWRSRGDEAKDGWVDATGCIRLFYPNFTVFIVLGHKCSLVISFPINMTQELEERIKYSLVPLPPSSQSCVLRGVVVLHGIRDERKVRDSSNSPKSGRMLWQFSHLVNS
jgi:hypothetical protein